MQDYNRKIIDEFRANEGRVGGPFAGAPMVLVTSTGAKSGRPHTTPLVYLREEDAKGGPGEPPPHQPPPPRGPEPREKGPPGGGLPPRGRPPPPPGGGAFLSRAPLLSPFRLCFFGGARHTS